MLLYEDAEVSAGTGAQQVPCSMYDHLSTPIVTSFLPTLDTLLRDSQVPSPSNIYDSSQFMDSTGEYSLLASVEEPFLPLQGPNKNLKDNGDCASALAVSLLESMADSVALQVKREIIDDASLFTPTNSNTYVSNVRVKCEEEEEVDLEEGQCRGGDLDTYQDNNLDQVQSMLMEHLTKDVRDTSHTLNISFDPCSWSSEDVHKWILFTLSQYRLPMVRLDYFNMDGISLCTLSEMDFRQRACNTAGDFLYAQLELWKTAADIGFQELACSPPPPLFQPEDSLLDISAYLQMPSHTQQSMGGSRSREESRSPESVVPSDQLNQALQSDYSSDGGGFQSDDDLSEDGLESADKCMSGVIESGGGVIPTRQGSHSHIHLWQFLKELLLHGQMYGSCIRWLDRSKGVFKIEDSVRVARLWGKRKNRPAMNYDKLSRSIRQYYKKGIMKKTERSQRLVYQFCHPYCL